MLLPSFVAEPLERVSEVLGVDVVFFFGLQIRKKLLELEWNAVFFFSVESFVVVPREKGLSEEGSVEERLEEAVHVASGPLVRQPRELVLRFNWAFLSSFARVFRTDNNGRRAIKQNQSGALNKLESKRRQRGKYFGV